MRGKKAVAGALSALMISMSVPVPAIADGIDEAQPATIEQAAGKEAAEDTASEAVPEQDADEAVSATQAVSDSADDDATAASEAVDDAEEPDRDVQDEQATYAAVAVEAVDVKEDAPAPTHPFDINNVLDTGNAVHYYANGSVKHATSIKSRDNVVSVGKPVYHDSGSIPYWTVEVTLKGEGVTADDYGVPTGYLGTTDPAEWVLDDSQENDFVTSFTLYKGQTEWEATVGAPALLHFKHEVPAPSAEDIAGMWGVAYYTLRNEDGSEAYTVTTQVKADDLTVGAPYQENGTWKVDVTIDALASPSDYGITLPGWYSGQYKLNSKDSKFTFTVTRDANGKWTASPLDAAKLVFDPVVAPAFDINKVLNVYGTVTYKVNKADGSSYENRTPLVSAENIASVGTPYQTEDGCWAVDVVLKGDPAPEDYAVPNWVLGGADYAFDAGASDLTLTFRTLTPEGATWYCSGNDCASLFFTEKTEAENPGTTTPGEDVGTGDDVENPEGNEDVKDPSDAEKSEDASDGAAEQGAEKLEAAKQRDGEGVPAQEGEDKLAQTGDPLNGLVAIAAAGTITLVAGIELKRRNGRDAR